MKILSATRTYLVLSALALLVILGLRAFAQPPPTPTPPTKKTFYLRIKNPTSLKVTDDVFERKMKALDATMDYDFILHQGGGVQDKPVAHGTPDPTAKLEIKTDRVITSDAAKNGTVFTLIQTRVTRQASTSSTTDIQAVLDTLQ